MALIYEIHIDALRKDFTSEAEARAAVEEVGFGRIVTFVQATHKYDRDRSCAMHSLVKGKWVSHDISR